MNHVLLSPVASASASAGSETATKTAGDPPDADLFRVALAAQSAPVVAVSKLRQTGITDAGPTQTALETKIKKMIESGASQAEIVAALAATLTASVTQQRSGAGDDARKKLQSVFAAALVPPGEPDGSSGSAADRARILAQRAMKLLGLAQSISGDQSGQQKRFSGTVLDAQRAKDIPAQPSSDQPSTAQASTDPPATTQPSAGITFAANAVLVPKAPLAAHSAPSVAGLTSNATARAITGPVSTVALRPAAPSLAAESVPASPVAPLTLGAAGNMFALQPPRADVPADVSGVADGQTVYLGSTIATAANGDTTLGRILTRAALAAQARQTPVAPASDDTSSTTSSDASSDASASVPAPVEPSVTAFVKAFAAALRDSTEADPAPAQRATQPGDLPDTVRASTNAPPAFVPSVAPFTIDRAQTAAPAAPAATPIPVDQSSIVDQVLRGAFMRSAGQASEIRLSLVPDSLGDVSVKLVVDAGNVTAHVVAETPEVRDALVSAQPELSRSLADAGLKLTSFTVDVSGGGFAGFAQQQNGQPQTGSRSRNGADSAETAGGLDESVVDAVPSFGPPIDAKQRLGDYNYLA